MMVRKSDPVNDALMLLLIQRRISQLEVEIDNRAGEEEERGEGGELSTPQQVGEGEKRSEQTRMTAGSREARELLTQLEQRSREAGNNQQLTKSFQYEGVGSKALPSQYVHKQG